MRAIWSGAISFGLVNIPVKMYSAVESAAGLDFDMLHKEDHSPIRFARICREDGEEVPYEEIVKGYEYQKGDYVVLDKEDFQRASPKKTKAIEIMDFAKESQIDTIFYEKPYFLEPDKGAEKPYALLREAIRQSKKVGIAKFVLRNREHLAVIKPHGNIIVLNQLRFNEEIRQGEDLKLPPKTSVKSNEVNMALSLIDQLTKPFKPEQYKDTYTEELKEVIEEKAKGKKITHKKAPAPKKTEVTNLMNMLKASIKEYQKEEKTKQKA